VVSTNFLKYADDAIFVHQIPTGEWNKVIVINIRGAGQAPAACEYASGLLAACLCRCGGLV
jgi:hypothetical protein